MEAGRIRKSVGDYAEKAALCSAQTEQDENEWRESKKKKG